MSLATEYEPVRKSLGEYFTDGWSLASGLQCAILEPGHHAERVWLLRRQKALAGPAPSSIANTLLETARCWSDRKSGLLVNEVLCCGDVCRATR